MVSTLGWWKVGGEQHPSKYLMVGTLDRTLLNSASVSSFLTIAFDVVSCRTAALHYLSVYTSGLLIVRLLLPQEVVIPSVGFQHNGTLYDAIEQWKPLLPHTLRHLGR